MIRVIGVVDVGNLQTGFEDGGFDGHGKKIDWGFFGGEQDSSLKTAWVGKAAPTDAAHTFARVLSQ